MTKRKPAEFTATNPGFGRTQREINPASGMPLIVDGAGDAPIRAMGSANQAKEHHKNRGTVTV